MQFRYVAMIVGGLMLAGSCLAYDNDLTHPDLARRTATVWNAEQARKLSPEEIRYLEAGALKEDLPEWRCFNHFLDPFSGGLELAPGLRVGKGMDEWSEAQNAILFGKDASWGAALKDYRAGKRGPALEKLGDILHLLGDAGLPAHTRNDQHLDGDTYESWIKQTQINNPGLLKIDDLKQPLPRVSCVDYEDCLRQMVIFTNRHFFSRDTISNSRFYEPYNSMSLHTDGYVYANGLMVAKWEVINEKFVLNDRVLLENWRVLEPMIIAYGQEIIKKFFAEVSEPQVLGLKIKPQIGTGLKIIAGDEIDLTDEDWPIPVVDASLQVPEEFTRARESIVSQGSGSELIIEMASSTEVVDNSDDHQATSTDSGSDDGTDNDQQGDDETGNDSGSGGGSGSGESATSTPTEGQADDGVPNDDTATSTDDGVLNDDTATSTPTEGQADDGVDDEDDETATSTDDGVPDHYEGLSASLNSLWHFNETEGAWANNAVAGAGALNMTATWEPGRFGGGVRQEAGDSFTISGPVFPELAGGELTLAIWFKDVSDYPISSSRSRIVLSRYGGDSAAGISPNFLYTDYFFDGQRDTLVSAMPQDHLWHLVVISYTTSGLKFYVDGVRQEVVEGDFAVPPGLNTIEMMGENAPSVFDELAIWNRELSAEEIRLWFESGLELGW